MTPYKERKVSPGQLVKVYRNLHRDGYSIADAKTGLVLGHANSVILKDVKFHVSKSGQERVRKEKRKSVHAWCLGKFVSSNKEKPSTASRIIYYNPYKTDYFQDVETGEYVFSTPLAYCEGKVVYGE